MARFRLRSWQEQTLYDCPEYEVEADSVEAAADLLDALQERAQEMNGPVELPPNVWRIDGGGRTMRALDPHHLVDSERGIAEIGADGRKRRDVLPAPADPPANAPARVLAAFVRDIEAMGVERATATWPDLAATYEAARAALTRPVAGA
jgi:hypothetical protein